MSATWELREGDCIEVMAAMPEASIDAVVCDPPYGIGFMGHEWDQPGVEHRAGPGKYEQPPAQGRTAPRSAGSMEAGKYDLRPTANRQFQAWCEAWAREAFRVLKPGGHMLVCGGARTFHRMTAGVEDAGFEIRDCLSWLYGSGFPKSLNVAQAIDRKLGAQPIEVGRRANRGFLPRASDDVAITTPATDEAAAYEGWGTALKPAWEPIIVARKPLVGTVAGNVLAHGTGALNVEGCRIGVDNEAVQGAGRWPANVALDEAAAEMLDEQSGELVSGANPTSRGSDKFRTAYGDFEGQRECEPARGAERGGASRFFYCAKASSAERNAGLAAFEMSDVPLTTTPTSSIANGRSGGRRLGDRKYKPAPAANVHPTVKPVDLMRWLVRLVTPGGGLVLDPFAGSGTTGCAAVREGFEFVGIEREAEYVAIAEARIAWWAAHPEGVETERVLLRDRERAEKASLGQLSMEAA